MKRMKKKCAEWEFISHAAEFILWSFSPAALNLHLETPLMICKLFPHNFLMFLPRDKRIFDHD